MAPAPAPSPASPGSPTESSENDYSLDDGSPTESWENDYSLDDGPHFHRLFREKLAEYSEVTKLLSSERLDREQERALLLQAVDGKPLVPQIGPCC
jgi:hypothetical protein